MLKFNLQTNSEKIVRAAVYRGSGRDISPPTHTSKESRSTILRASCYHLSESVRISRTMENSSLQLQRSSTATGFQTPTPILHASTAGYGAWPFWSASPHGEYGEFPALDCARPKFFRFRDFRRLFSPSDLALVIWIMQRLVTEYGVRVGHLGVWPNQALEELK